MVLTCSSEELSCEQRHPFLSCDVMSILTSNALFGKLGSMQIKPKRQYSQEGKRWNKQWVVYRVCSSFYFYVATFEMRQKPFQNANLKTKTFLEFSAESHVRHGVMIISFQPLIEKVL